MAKRGRKKYTESQSERDRLYQSYIGQYQKASSKRGLSPMLSKQAFDKIYDQQYVINNGKNVIRSIVSDQASLSTKQIHRLAKMATEKGYYLNYKQAYSSIKMNDNSAIYFWQLVNEYGFREVMEYEG